MLPRPLGTTGLAVYPLALGGAAIGQQYGPVSPAEVRATVRAALDAGVNLVDTSAYYGAGRSEELLGEALDGGPRGRVILATKAGRLGRNRFDFTPAGLRDCLHGSLKRLRTDHVDVLFAHDIEFAPDFDRALDGVADALAAFKREGLARFVGVSAHPLGLLRHCVERYPLDVVLSYTHFTLQNETLLTGLLPAAEARGVGVLNGSPLGMGLLTPGGPPPWNPAPAAIRDACRAAAEWCSARGLDLPTLALQFCVQEPRIAATVTGTARPDELAANLAAVTRPIDWGAVAGVRGVLAAVMGQTWASGNWRDGDAIAIPADGVRRIGEP